MAPLFAFLDNAREAMNELVENLLLVAGGFMVGYVLGWVGGWAVGRYIFRLKDTSGIKAIARPVCGVVVALIVALIIFTGKGRPHGSGGDGKGTDADDPKGGKSSPAKVESDPKKPDDLKKPPEVKPPDVLVTVTLYARSRERDERHYQYDAESESRTFDELQKAILARKAAEKGKLTLVVRLPSDPNEHPGDPRVRSKLVEWASTQGIDVIVPANK